MSLLAVDIGSSSCKAIAFSDNGHVLAQSSCSYSGFQSPHPSWAEIPAGTFWQAFCTVTQSISSQTKNDEVEVLSISSHGETFVPVDQTGQAIGLAILNMDNRAVSEARWLSETIGRHKLFQITGLAVHPMYPIAKMLWLRKHAASVFSMTSKFLPIPSYLVSRLGLPPYVDYSLASRFLAFDIHQRTWSKEILDQCGFSPEQFPTPVPAGTIAGQLTLEVASKIGLQPDVLVVVGGHDQPCGALGCGVLGPGRVSASLGTYECLVAVSEAPNLSDRALAANLNCYCHVVPDRYVTLAYFPAGIMLDWLLGILYSGKQLCCERIAAVCQRLEAETSPGPSELCITPHLLGSCNPDFDPLASGTITGIRPGTTRADLYKAVLEGIACEFASMSKLMEPAAGVFRDVYITGGGTNSRLGLELRSSLSGCDLHRMECADTVCLGTAMLAGLAAGKYGSFAEAVDQLVRVTETISPNDDVAARYKTKKERYQILYSSLAPFRRVQADYD